VLKKKAQKPAGKKKDKGLDAAKKAALER